MYNIKNPDRLDFIRKISKERGIDEIFSIEDAKKNDIVKDIQNRQTYNINKK